MKKNFFKSMVKSTARAIWKILFKPVMQALPDSKVKHQILRAGKRIEHREWWPKPPKNTKIDLNSIGLDLINELKELGSIEPNLQPSKHFLNELSQHSYKPFTGLQDNSYGEAYGLLLRHLKTLHFDVVFLAPWLKRGGADLGLLHHINAQNEKGMKILLITTEKAESTWIDKLPASVTHLNFYAFSKKINSHKASELLARLLLQIDGKTIHNVNSLLGWDVFKRYGLQLKSMHKKLFASVFCEDEYEPQIYFGYASYLPETFRNMEKVFCDTKWYPKEQDKLTGLGGFLTTVYFPFLGQLHPYSASVQVDFSPILWASRIAKQKRPELLYKIAQSMPNQTFHVYGEVDRGCKKILQQLMSLPNIKYFGKYDSFSQILKNKKYSVFLYTSQYDGLPNVLIEAISHGLPVISYDVGGIGELIYKDVLLSDNDCFETTLKKIKELLNDTDLLYKSWQKSQSILRERHGWTHFVETLEKVDQYFPSKTTESGCFVNCRVLSKPENN